MRASVWTIAALAAAVFGSMARGDDWPQWLGPKRDSVWRETGILDKFPPGGPKVLWSQKIGEGYAGPAVAGGRVYVTDRIRPAGEKNPDNPFGRSRVRGTERVLCLDEKSGKILWTHDYDCPYEVSYPGGPRATPVVHGDRVYTLGAMGNLLCLDVHNGKVIWSHDLAKEYNVQIPTWGFAAHPLLDGNRLIGLVGGKDSVAVAFNKDTGKEIWRALSAREPGYAPPVIFDVGGVRQLIIWHPQAVNGLDPVTGKVYWSFPFTNRAGGQLKAGLAVPTPRLDGDLLFLTAFYEGPLMLKLNGTATPSQLWRGKGRGELPDQTDGLHSIIPSPIIKDGYIYGVCSYGELRCLKESTGERIWQTHQATGGQSLRWANAFLVEQDGRFFLFNEQGDLIIARLTPAKELDRFGVPKGYEEISRAHILEPTNTMAPPAGRKVVWSHPAFANRCCFARNDKEIVCVSLAARR